MRVLLPAVLREEPQFRLLFAGQALSVLGDRITYVALPFAALEVGDGAGDVGLVAAAAFAPFLLFALVGGVTADRRDRRRLMLASDVVRALSQGLMAVLLLSGAAEVWHLVALMAVFGTADAFFAPAMQGVIPQTVAPARLQDANALRGMTMSAGAIGGPVVAGLLIALVGPGGAIAIDAATFVVSALCLLALRPRPVEREAVEVPPRFTEQLAEGWAEIAQRDWVKAGLFGLAVYHVVVLPAVFVLGPVLAEAEYGGATDWAWVVAAFGVGSVLGDVLVFRLKPARPILLSFSALAIASTQAVIIGSGLPIAGIAALECVAGIAVSVFFILWETTLQEQIPERAISRVSSFDHLASAGLMPLGFALAGPVVATIGLHETLVLQSLIGVPAALALLLVPGVSRVGRGAASSPS